MRVETGVVRRRIIAYLATAAVLPLFYVFARSTAWNGSTNLHTEMETAATLISLMVGAIALVRFYSRKNNTFLFIGAGFLGTALLDGYQAVVTSALLAPLMPSDLSALIPWSWAASRQFLSVFMFLSYVAWRREHRLGEAGRIGERSVYLLSGLFTLLSFGFFAIAPLPPAYFSNILMHRPEELFPAALFAAALIGYLRKNDWRHDAFEHWLVLSLIVAVVGQTVFMPFSAELFDMEFNVAHLLKKLSYICVLTGLLASMYTTFRQEARHGEAMTEARDRAASALAELTSHKMALDKHAIVGVTDTAGTITYVNDKFCQVSGYGRDELIGRNHRVLNSGHHPKTFFQKMYRTIAGGQSWRAEIRNRAKDGSHYWVDTTITPFRDASAKIVQYVAIRTDITARITAEAAIAASRDQLARANVQKDKFMLIIAHDLRSPFNTLLGYSEFLATQSKSMDHDKIAKYGALVHHAADQAYSLLEDLFDWARLQLDRMDLDPKPVDVRQIVNASLARFRSVAAAKEVGLTGEVAEAITVRTDAPMVDTILRNLISNSIKFTRTKGAITVSAQQRGGHVEFKVRDTGIGMSAQKVRRLFSLDQKSSTLGTDGETGTGLGLHLCRELVEKLGGEIHVESTEGEGTVVNFTLSVDHE